VSTQALSTGGHGPLLRRSLGRALIASTLVVAVIFALAAGPVLVSHPEAFVRSFTRAGALHAPNLAPLMHAPLAVQIHLATILAALGVTGVLLLGVKGSRLHRTLGWAWATAMLATAVSALFIRAAPFGPHIGPFGVLHLFALITLVSVPRAIVAARRHDVASHAGIISGFVIGGLGIAGLSAFLPGRLMWSVFFG
jgi:uncharacterized membrane protein